MSSSFFNQAFSKKASTVALASALIVPSVSMLPATAAPQDQALNPVTPQPSVPHDNTSNNVPTLHVEGTPYDSQVDSTVTIHGSGYNQEGARNADGSVNVYIGHTGVFNSDNNTVTLTHGMGTYSHFDTVPASEINEDGSFTHQVNIPADHLPATKGPYNIATYAGDAPKDDEPERTTTAVSSLEAKAATEPRFDHSVSLDKEGNLEVKVRGEGYYNTDPAKPVHAIIREYDPQTQQFGEHTVTDFTIDFNSEGGYKLGHFDASHTVPQSSFDPNKTYTLVTTDNPENPQDSKFYKEIFEPFTGVIPVQAMPTMQTSPNELTPGVDETINIHGTNYRFDHGDDESIYVNIVEVDKNNAIVRTVSTNEKINVDYANGNIEGTLNVSGKDIDPSKDYAITVTGYQKALMGVEHSRTYIKVKQ